MTVHEPALPQLHSFASSDGSVIASRSCAGDASACECAVILAQDISEPPMYKHILVPIDGSEPSNNALRTAISLAKEVGARIRLLHVLDNSAYLTGYDATGGANGELFAALRDSGLQILAEGATTARAEGLEVDHLLVDDIGGRLGELVAKVATQFGADLIVVGTHGHSGPSRLLLGSGAEQIIRLSPVPVLVTRQPSH
jgi:nucleotide-binding universal stress UspA family protein